MASEKKPSIYSDRSSIGSAEELDEYGVWVKSEPQVLSAISADIQKSSDLSLTSENEAFEEPDLSSEEFSTDDFVSDDFSMDDLSDDTSSAGGASDDFTSDDFTDDDFTSGASEDNSSVNVSSEFDDIDFPNEDMEKADVIDDVINNIEEVAEIEEINNIDDAEDINIEDVSIDDNDNLQNSGITAESSETDSAETADDFDIDSNFDDDSDGVTIDDNTGADDLDLLSDSPIETISDDLEDSSYEVPTVQSISEKSSTDNLEVNIANIQNDYETIVQNKEAEYPPILKGEDSSADLSTQLLLKIANELSSIRGELSELKREFSIVRSSVPQEAAQEAKEQQHAHEHSGFFSEEEDETIALTGDELGNILNTADFTEESGANETPESEFSPGIEAESMDAESAIEPLADISSMDDLAISSLDDMDDINIDTTDNLESIEIDAVETEDTTAEPEDIDIEIEAIELDDITSDEIASETEDADFDDFTSVSDDFDDVAAVIDQAAPSSELEESDDGFTPDSAEPEADELSAETFEETGDDIVIEDEPVDIYAEALGVDLDSDIILDEPVEMDELDSDIPQEDFSDNIDTSENVEEIHLDDVMELDDLDIDASADTDIYASVDTDIDTGVDTDIDESADTDIDASADTDIDIDESKDSDELKALREEGAQPVTFAPENSSYLEEDSGDSDSLGFDADEFDSDPLDLSDAIIDEPVLSTEGIDEPVTEPEIDLDAFDSGSLDDFSIDEEEQTAPVTADEGADDISEDTDMTFDDTVNDDLDIDVSADDELIIDEADDEELDIDMPVNDPVFQETTRVSTFADDNFEQVIPEGFEAEIEDTPVPFDDDLEEKIAADNIDDTLDIPNEALSVEEEEEAPQTVKAESFAAPETSVKQQIVKNDNYQMIPSELKLELRNILSYMDQLLDSLPEEKIEEFAKSEYFDSYKKLFKELGLV